MATSWSGTEIRRDAPWRLALGGIGIAIGLALCVALLHLSGHGVDHVMAALRRVNPKLAVAAGLAMGVNYALAAKKWQRVEASLSGSPHTFVHAWAATAIGMGVGQFLPTVVSSALVRGLGNRAVRRSGRYGAIASGWEQLFDLAVAGLLVGPCIAALAFGYIRLAVAVSAAALLAGETCCVRAARLMVRLARLDANLATPSLSKFLWRVSLMRIVVLMAVTVMIGRAFALNIAPWELATAVPAVVLASVLSFIPAGLGVNELTFVGLLGSAGTPVPIAAAFALLNRTLQVCIALVLAICGGVLVGSGPSAAQSRARASSTETEF